MPLNNLHVNHFVTGLFSQAYADDVQIYFACAPEETVELRIRVQNCVVEVAEWMAANRLAITPGKTKLMWLSILRRGHLNDRTVTHIIRDWWQRSCQNSKRSQNSKRELCHNKMVTAVVGYLRRVHFRKYISGGNFWKNFFQFTCFLLVWWHICLQLLKFIICCSCGEFSSDCFQCFIVALYGNFVMLFKFASSGNFQIIQWWSWCLSVSSSILEVLNGIHVHQFFSSSSRCFQFSQWWNCCSANSVDVLVNIGISVAWVLSLLLDWGEANSKQLVGWIFVLCFISKIGILIQDFCDWQLIITVDHGRFGEIYFIG